MLATPFAPLHLWSSHQRALETFKPTRPTYSTSGTLYRLPYSEKFLRENLFCPGKVLYGEKRYINSPFLN